MNIRKVVRIICFTLLLSTFPFRVAAEDFTNAIQAFLQHRGNVEKTDGAIVVGILDEHGSSVVSYGKLDNGTDREVNGDTVFNIYSSTCAFTGLLLEDMIARGEMKLDDPVAKYLPKSVKMLTYNGKQITLRHLVMETSGLPDFYDSQDPKSAENPFADFTPEKMYACLSGYQLTSEPGLVHVHGGVAMGLLGQAIALKAETNYESLVVDWICRPLKMDSTRGTLTPELKSRLAIPHPSQRGYAVLVEDPGAMMPLSGLHSTANDMLKLVSANLGFTSSSLPPPAQFFALFPTSLEKERGIYHFGGGNRFVGPYTVFDTTRHRGVVVLSSSGNGLYNAASIGKFLIESEWQSDLRPKETNNSSQVYDSYVGQYRLTSTVTPSKFAFWPLFHRHTDTIFRPGIDVRCEGHRLFIQATISEPSPTNGWLPPLPLELLPQSETGFFERLSGMPVTFSRNSRGEVTGLIVHEHGKVHSYERISDQQPKLPELPTRPVAIKLETGLLDVCVGNYEQAPCAALPTGAKVAVWREGDQLLFRASGKNALKGAVNIYPESETNFFDKLVGNFTFLKNDKGEVTAVIIHVEGFPEIAGRKVPEPAK